MGTRTGKDRRDPTVKAGNGEWGEEKLASLERDNQKKHMKKIEKKHEKKSTKIQRQAGH